ncbi:MAG TPA: SGNH/GDSL hydrolase family protein [Candidatus Acidoferrum sp.]|nr:SGNH/GDSL hydrolase family protein [Candidatus Acidoferrum sp.]
MPRIHNSFTIAALLLTAVLLPAQLSFSQAQAPAPAPAPAPASTVHQATPEEQAAYDRLTPYQRSLLERIYNDWPYLAKYREADKALPTPSAGEARVVFMGDSITEGWGQAGVPAPADHAEFFPGKPYVNRGISGQTTPQMLVRFRQDVVALQPKAVVILAGINDIAENTGKTTLEAIEDNFASMSEIARANGIQVVLCSTLPASAFPWHPGLQPAPEVKALNAWLRNYAATKGLIYVDYYTPMANAEGGLKAELGRDGVHPNKAGYELMAPLAEAGIGEALKKPLP